MTQLLRDWNVPANRKVEKFINSFLDRNGGIDKLNEELNINKPKETSKRCEQKTKDARNKVAIKRRASFQSTSETITEPKFERQTTLTATTSSNRNKAIRKRRVEKNEISQPYDFKRLQNIVVENGKFKVYSIMIFIINFQV
jgi:hypothetical protein